MIKYTGDIKQIPDYAKVVLGEVLEASGNPECVITSTTRTTEDQARVMFWNCKNKGVKSQYKLYGYYGDKVIAVYDNLVSNHNFSNDYVIYAMTEKIREIGPQNVSKHCVDDPNYSVFDIDPESIENQESFSEKLLSDTRIKKLILPGNDPAYHIEIEA